MTGSERPIDWRQVCDDLALALADDPAPGVDRTPLGTHCLARALGFTRGAVRNWRAGSRPTYDDGARLVARWVELTGKSADELPRA